MHLDCCMAGHGEKEVEEEEEAQPPLRLLRPCG